MNPPPSKKTIGLSRPHASICIPARLVPARFLCRALASGVSLAGFAWAANIAPEGAGIMGFNDAIDADAGTSYFQAGVLSHINDTFLGTRVDDWSNGTDGGQNVSFVGVVWTSLRYEEITTLTLTLATFYDGGWFG